MALKDWKKTMPDGWTNNKNLNKIRIRYENDMYAFYLYDKNWRSKKIKNFPFYKGSAAFKYAMNYMRKH